MNRANRYLLLTVACAVLSVAGSVAWLFHIFPRDPWEGAVFAKLAPIVVTVTATWCFSISWFLALLFYTGVAWLRSPASFRQHWRIPVGHHATSLCLLTIVGISSLRQKHHSDDYKDWDALTHGATVELADFRPLIDAYSSVRHNEQINSDWRRQILHFATLNKGATPEYLSYLAKHLSDASNLMPVVALNPNTPEDVLRRCAQIPDCQALLAQNPSTPQDILTRLAASENSGVRGHTAANPNTPRDVVTRLANDPESWIRTWATNNLKQHPQ